MRMMGWRDHSFSTVPKFPEKYFAKKCFRKILWMYQMNDPKLLLQQLQKYMILSMQIKGKIKIRVNSFWNERCVNRSEEELTTNETVHKNILSLQKYMIVLRKPRQILNLNRSHKVSVSKSFALPWSWVHLFICKWYVRSFQFYRLPNRVYRVMIAQLYSDFVKIRSIDTDWKISWNSS